MVPQPVSVSRWQEAGMACPVAYGEACEACVLVVVVVVAVVVAYEVAS